MFGVQKMPADNKTSKPVSASQVISTQLVLPSDTNALGSVFGGTIMSWVDIVAAICGQRHANAIVVTASIDELHFIQPVYLGWVVNLKASCNFVAKSSMEIGVRVDAENPSSGDCFHTASAYLTFVALDEGRRPLTVPGLILENEEQKLRFSQGQRRREHRLLMRAERRKKI